MSAGFVYFIEAVSLGRVKIGRAQDPQRRLRELQTGSSVQLVLRRAIETPDPVLLERDLHARFASARSSGEWFRYTADVAQEIGPPTIGNTVPEIAGQLAALLSHGPGPVDPEG